MDTNSNIKAITDLIIEEFVRIAKEVKFDPHSVFFRPQEKIEEDTFLKLLKFYNTSNFDKVNIPKPNEKAKSMIDNVLAVYLILIIEVTRDKFFLELIVKFVFLFREYLNMTGWDYLAHLHSYGLYDDLRIEGEFCSKVNCEEIPELVNDFVVNFLQMEDKFSIHQKELVDITQNFCYWLFINELTNFKLAKLENSSSWHLWSGEFPTHKYSISAFVYFFIKQKTIFKLL